MRFFFFVSHMFYISPDKKIPVFRVSQPYLNLLVKPRIFSGFLAKIYYFMRFERRRNFFFPEEKIIKKKYVCLPYTYNFQTRYLKHTYFLFCKLYIFFKRACESLGFTSKFR